MEFLALLKEVGFENAELVGKTGFNSTPKTEGVLVRAVKPQSSISIQKLIEETIPAEQKGERKPPSIEAVIDRAYALGCEKAKIIDTSTVVVKKWVRWKCLYGCPFFDKNEFHPPFAPSVNETREVLTEYSKAILLKGPKGKTLTDIAVRLEYEAYQMGFYKAFALISLSSGSGGESNPGET